MKRRMSFCQPNEQAIQQTYVRPCSCHSAEQTSSQVGKRAGLLAKELGDEDVQVLRLAATQAASA